MTAVPHRADGRTPSKRPAASASARPRRRNERYISYDELVLQWAMGASDLPPSVRADTLALTTAHHNASRPFLAASTAPADDQGLLDELQQEMHRCVDTLRTEGDHRFRAVDAFRQLHVSSVLPLLSRDVKLELCFRHVNESLLSVKAVWEELQRQQRSLTSTTGMELMEDAVWRPSASSSGESFALYAAYGIGGVVFARVYDVLTFDAAGYIRLIARTLLFQPDDASRGQTHMGWAPSFGRFLQGPL